MRRLMFAVASFGLLVANSASAQYLPGAVPGTVAPGGQPNVGQMLLPQAQGVAPQIQYRPRQVTTYARQILNIPQWQYEQRQAQAPYTYYTTEYRDVVQRRYRPRVVYDPVDITIKVPQLKPNQAMQTYNYTVPKLGFVQQERVLPQARTVYDAVAGFQYNYTVDPGAQVLGNQGAIIQGQQPGTLPAPQIIGMQNAAAQGMSVQSNGAMMQTLPGNQVQF